MIVWAILAIVILVLILICLYMLSNFLFYPPRQPLRRHPEDYGLHYENVSFLSTDRLTIKGWWIPGKLSKKVVILVHPFSGNRHGLTARRKPWPNSFRADVDLLKVAQIFNQNDWAVLLFDLRSHGESPRKLCGGGFTEDQDVIGAVDYAFKRFISDNPDGQKQQVCVVGFGLGATAALVAVGRVKGKAEKIMVFTGDMEGGAGYTEIQPPNIKLLSSVIVVQPISPGNFLYCYLESLFPKLGMLVPLVDRLCQTRGGYPLDGNLLFKAAREIHLPVLLIRPRLTPKRLDQELQSLYEALAGAKQIEWVEGSLDLLGVYRKIINDPQPILNYASKTNKN
jgi:pimeloyl-ACP methyl ester carboxylesterase